MKIILIILLSFSYAQAFTQVCRIDFTYDDQGNRIQKISNCETLAKTDSSDIVKKDFFNDDFSQLKIFPNPTKGLVFIQIPPGFENYSLSVINANGSNIIQQKVGSAKLSVDLNNYPSGIYYFRMTNGKNTITKKIVKL